MMILINVNILDVVLDLIDMDFFSHPSCGTGRNYIIFGVDVSSSTKIDNKKSDILILRKGPTQGLEHTILQKKCIQLVLQGIIKIMFELSL